MALSHVDPYVYAPADDYGSDHVSTQRFLKVGCVLRRNIHRFAEVNRHLPPMVNLLDRNGFSYIDYRLNMSSIPFEALHVFCLLETLMPFCSCREGAVPVSRDGGPMDIDQPRQRA